LTRLAPILILSPAYNIPGQNSIILNVMHFSLDATTFCLILLFQIPKKKKFFVVNSNKNNSSQLSKEQNIHYKSSFTSRKSQRLETQENINITNVREGLSSDPTTPDKKTTSGTEDSASHSIGAKGEEEERNIVQTNLSTNRNTHSDQKSDLNSSNSLQHK
jgi:hypothetical protein